MVSVFRVSEIDWVAADTAQAAKEFYLRWIADGHQGADLEDVYDHPYEVRQDGMDRLKYQADEDSRVTRTFREELARRVAAGE